MSEPRTKRITLICAVESCDSVLAQMDDSLDHVVLTATNTVPDLAGATWEAVVCLDKPRARILGEFLLAFAGDGE